MGSKTLIYKKKVNDNLQESFNHLKRMDSAFLELQKKYTFPIDKNSHNSLMNNTQDLAFSDQIIYRFSKLQDVMGAKLFKSLLLYQGENIDRPFLDILNSLEKMDIIDVEEWFEIRDLRNEIAHDYEDAQEVSIEILNSIYELKSDLTHILSCIKESINENR